MVPNNEFDLFISHATEDKAEIARPLTEYLIAMGIKVWYDEESVLLGERISGKVFEGLERSVGAILVLTETYIEKMWTNCEAGGIFYKWHNEGGILYILYWTKELMNRLPFTGDIKSINMMDGKSLEIATVEIYKDFKKKEKTSIRYKYPYGIKRILPSLKPSEDNELESASHFTDFLENTYLKYLSRGKFKSTLSLEEQKLFYSENDILKLLGSKESNGLVIHGQGGIGKTRLMLELGKRLARKNDYVVLQVSTTFKLFNQLVEYIEIRPDKNYVLLFDYIEIQSVFEDTIEWIRSKKHNIKIIGNCRNSFVPEVRSNFIEELYLVDIGIKNEYGKEIKIESNYKQAIILSILDSISDIKLYRRLTRDKTLKTFCKTTPSFAVFIKYMYLKNKTDNPEISVNEGFSNWLVKKLKLSIVKDIKYSNFYEDKKNIFFLLSCLPANQDSVNILESNFAGEINTLFKDGWIDKTDGQLKTVHDTVNDTLLIEFLKNYRFEEFYFKCLFEFALSNRSISSMLFSIQRIWEDIPWLKLPDDRKSLIQNIVAKFIDENLDENISAEDWFKYRIDSTHLLTELSRINLFIKYKSILKENFANRKFGRALAYSMEWINKNIIDSELRKIYAEELKELFNEWNANDRHNYFVKTFRGGNIISCYINLYGIDEYIRNRFYEYIDTIVCNNNELESISLAIVSWFRRKGEVSPKLIAVIQKWFEVYNLYLPDKISPTYLIKCCIANGITITYDFEYVESKNKDIKTIHQRLLFRILTEKYLSIELKKQVATWFNAYCSEQPDDFYPLQLIRSWMEKGGEELIVKESIEKIISDPYKDRNLRAKFIMFWLQYSNNSSLVYPYISGILNEEIMPIKALLIIRFWLEKDNNPLIIKPFLKKWLTPDMKPRIFCSIIKNWLSKSDEPHIIIEYIKSWILIGQDQTSVGHILNTFIINGGNFYDLKGEIFEWLKLNGNNSKSIAVLGHILEMVNDHSLYTELEVYVIESLSQFSSLKEAGYCIGYWIEKCDNLEVVEPFINKWLKIWGISEQGNRIIGHWLEQNGNCDHVKEFIIPCCENFSCGLNVSQLIVNWIKYGDDANLITEFLKSYFEIEENRVKFETKGIIIAWLDNTKMPLVVKETIKPWLTKYGDLVDSIRVCSLWLDKSEEIEIVEDYIRNSFFNFADIKDGHLVIENWIKKDGNLKIVERSIEKNLDKEWDDVNTIYTATLWLSKHGSQASILNYVKNKSQRYAYLKDCFHLINLWLSNSGDFESIKQLLISYIKNNLNSTYSIALIKKCIHLDFMCYEIEQFIFEIIRRLDYNPYKSLIEIEGNYIIRKEKSEFQIDSQRLLDEAYKLSFEITNHLKTGNSPELIKDSVLEFLRTNGKENFASHVLSAWLEYGNDFRLIEFFLMEWLDKNLLEEVDSSFVVAAALEIEEGFKTIHHKAIEWFSNFGRTETAKFPLSSWLKLKGNEGSDEIKEWIIYWVENFYVPTNHWRDDLLLNYVLWLSKKRIDEVSNSSFIPKAVTGQL